jgi:hypothetical protein
MCEIILETLVCGRMLLSIDSNTPKGEGKDVPTKEINMYPDLVSELGIKCIHSRTLSSVLGKHHHK